MQTIKNKSKRFNINQTNKPKQLTLCNNVKPYKQILIETHNTIIQQNNNNTSLNNKSIPQTPQQRQHNKQNQQ